MKAFTSVYFDLKDQPIRDQSMYDLLNQYPEITKARYGELLRSSFNGDELKLSNQEAAFINEIRFIKKQEEKGKLFKEKKACLNHRLPHSSYQKMLQAYKSNHHFQNELKPHFQNYLNQ